MIKEVIERSSLYLKTNIKKHLVGLNIFAIFTLIKYNNNMNNNLKNQTQNDLTINSLQNLINNRIDDEKFNKMDDLANKEDILIMINSSERIMNDLVNQGFEVKDIFYYLYETLIWNV
jgi:hypothetical protein